MSNHSFHTSLGDGIPVRIEFDWQPKEPGTLEYPGCDESVEINEVLLETYDLLEILSNEVISALQVECLEHWHAGPSD